MTYTWPVQAQIGFMYLNHLIDHLSNHNFFKWFFFSLEDEISAICQRSHNKFTCQKEEQKQIKKAQSISTHKLAI